ncbi:MAG TPA: BON domain-containing protein [Candidatus Saccharimonadales bacterium]|nr:BON domain-containing protein [Candidatus Saccharimonadales bacterium]
MRKYKLITMALAAALVLGVSCSHSGKKADDAIVTGIKAKMFSEPALNAANVEVASQSGVVTLAGQVPDEAAHLAAYKIATQTAGVSKVNDQLSVGNPQQAMASAPSPSEQPAAAPPPSKVKAKPLSKSAQQIENSESSAPPDADTPVPAPSPEVAAPPSPAPAPQPVKVTIPANTIVSVRTIDGVDSSKDRTGEVFKASVDAPIVVDERAIIPVGATAYLKLVNASSAGRMTGRSELTLALINVVFQGKTYNVTSSDVKQSGASRGKRTAATVGGGAALGALIGAIAGGGKGAAIGAGVGAGAGTGVQVFTKGQQVKIPSETRLDFTLQSPFEVTYISGKRSKRTAASEEAAAEQEQQ